jgi:hypothetical protein
MDGGVRWLAHASWHFSVTFVRGVSAGELGRRLGADPAAVPVPATARGVEALLVDPNVGIARLGEAGGWAFAVEYGEARGVRGDVLAEISRGGVAVSLDPQADHPPPMFSFAADGDVLCSFGLSEEGRRWGSEPDVLNAVLRSAGILAPDGSVLGTSAGQHAQQVAMSLGAIERHFGLSLPRNLIEHGELPAMAVSGNPDLSTL